MSTPESVQAKLVNAENLKARAALLKRTANSIEGLLKDHNEDLTSDQTIKLEKISAELGDEAEYLTETSDSLKSEAASEARLLAELEGLEQQAGEAKKRTDILTKLINDLFKRSGEEQASLQHTSDGLFITISFPETAIDSAYAKWKLDLEQMQHDDVQFTTKEHEVTPEARARKRLGVK